MKKNIESIVGSLKENLEEIIKRSYIPLEPLPGENQSLDEELRYYRSLLINKIAGYGEAFLSLSLLSIYKLPEDDLVSLFLGGLFLCDSIPRIILGQGFIASLREIIGGYNYKR